MKKLKLSILILVYFFTILSCSKSPNATSNPSAQNGYINCKVDGTYWSSKYVLGETDTALGYIGGAGFTDTSIQANEQRWMAIVVEDKDYITGKTVRIDSNYFFGINIQFSALYEPNGISYPSISGTVNITNASSTFFEGTFNFIGRDDSTRRTKNITEGKFKIPR